MEVPGSPLDMRNGKCEPITTQYVHLAAGKGGRHGIAYKNFDDHFVLVFDLTSSREASKTLALFPQLTGGSLALKLTLEEHLEPTIELFIIAEKFSQIFITSE